MRTRVPVASVLVVLLIAGCLGGGRSIEQIRADLNANLPQGSSKQQVQAFLDRHDYPSELFTLSRQSIVQDDLESEGLTPGAPGIFSGFSEGHKDFAVYFIFTEADELDRIIVTEGVDDIGS